MLSISVSSSSGLSNSLSRSFFLPYSSIFLMVSVGPGISLLVSLLSQQQEMGLRAAWASAETRLLSPDPASCTACCLASLQDRPTATTKKRRSLCLLGSQSWWPLIRQIRLSLIFFPLPPHSCFDQARALKSIFGQ